MHQPLNSPVFAADDDPLTIHPPVLETLEERNQRVAREKRAKEISDKIDAEIERERMEESRSGKTIRILLLGQSESGKSTTLKNFQLMYDPKTFRAERASWRSVIQLNVVQSVRYLLTAMDSASIPNQPFSARKGFPAQTPDLLEAKSRLRRLLDIEQKLVGRLTQGAQAVDLSASSSEDSSSSESPRTRKEVAINSAVPWKRAFNRLVSGDGPRGSFDSAEGVDSNDPDDPWPLLQELSGDIKFVWLNPIAKYIIARQKVKGEDFNGYFLDSIDRIAKSDYIPSNDDVLRARLKTLGASEHKFRIPTEKGSIKRWKLYDVGGHRSQVTAWVPFFDNMDAIIFLAPLSCFDQVLEEDHRVNRLEDSIKLWMTIVSNDLLKNTNLILFLNKIDLLRHKLESGIYLKDWVVSYGDRPNDLDNIKVYMKRKFGGVLAERSPTKRPLFCHFTTVTDTKSTSLILANLQESLMRSNLHEVNLLV